ncbi:NUDIX hydrolase domain protein [Akanthomyces lecanii RCEF 1005]|uniref:NUDIX hydrolase domain protein n=1 Tax=Akanthomyces lecanii RCEF 1005 TaxID=1081108 RepID=A0A162KWM0_CORDF|nr:NUDIX hydrolase domain protein [Akanthomyces lecanii RCEF 1005]
MTTQAPKPRPSVGVSVAVVNPKGQVLFSKRKGSHGAGTWQFPGGHLEHGKTPLECAEDEVQEETGLLVTGVKIVTLTNDIFEAEGKHYVTLFAKLQHKEKDKCEGWEWWSWEKFFSGKETGVAESNELFLPLKNLLKEFSSVDELKAAFH